jgi:murein DD-endopeptidase MepM/ murein hydrolase activator NlpD
MPTDGSPRSHSFVRRKPPHRIVIAHGENVRSFTIRPWLIATIGGTFAAFGVLYFTATGYLVFHDDLLAASLARESRMQHAYEDRIAALRADIDRLTSRQLLNQDAVEAEMDRLSGRQAALDARQDSIAGLSQAARLAGLQAVEPPAAGAAPDQINDHADDSAADSSSPPDVAAPAPAKDPLKTGSIAPTKAGALSFLFASLRDQPAPETTDTPAARMTTVENSLDALARDQVAYVDAIAAKVTNRSDQIAAILKGIGQSVPPSRLGEGDGVGGPMVELDPSTDPGAFRATIDLLTGEIDRYSTVRRLATTLPLERPILSAPITSGFGARMDPFLGRPAMHTGVDFRAPTGYAARATAGGTVINAAYTGGYGNMVEIDHGNGITTRYGHLSRIDVTVGQIVAKGAIVGHTGSTGRSTGPHLHYEVRIDGSAIDPLTYIRAGAEIAPLL